MTVLSRAYACRDWRCPCRRTYPLSRRYGHRQPMSGRPARLLAELSATLWVALLLLALTALVLLAVVLSIRTAGGRL